MRDLRNDADYGHSELDVDIEAIAARSEAFVDGMESVLDR